MKVIKLSNIGFPSSYIRSAVSDEHVADLRDVVQRSDKTYPFDDPIVVRLLDKPAKYKVTMAGKAGTCEYECVKGVHRCTALVAEKYTEVSCDIEKFSSPADAYFAQYDEHGVLKVSRADRAAFIKRLRVEFKWSLEQIAQKMRLSTASISRILRNLQATGKKVTAKKTSPRKETDSAEETVEFNASAWFEELGQMVLLYTDHKDEVQAFSKSVDPKLINIAYNMMSDLTIN